MHVVCMYCANVIAGRLEAGGEDYTCIWKGMMAYSSALASGALVGLDRLAAIYSPATPWEAKARPQAGNSRHSSQDSPWPWYTPL